MFRAAGPIGLSADSGSCGRSEVPPSKPSGMEKLREWFGSPTAAAKTLVSLMWASLLISIAPRGRSDRPRCATGLTDPRGLRQVRA